MAERRVRQVELNDVLATLVQTPFNERPVHESLDREKEMDSEYSVLCSAKEEVRRPTLIKALQNEFDLLEFS